MGGGRTESDDRGVTYRFTIDSTKPMRRRSCFRKYSLKLLDDEASCAGRRHFSSFPGVPAGLPGRPIRISGDGTIRQYAYPTRTTSSVPPIHPPGEPASEPESDPPVSPSSR